ncbi:Cell division protein FtsW [Dermatophilus congolensis]|uniref:Probable peptidoglycan glycosyltransferase FtsW n=2 Tax=Dermatophilus congolensis TaxID=1863 RepID=A0AA46GZU9_9MICO|nr:Cell division protein FtsW [Dermatophilus congolensis]
MSKQLRDRERVIGERERERPSLWDRLESPLSTYYLLLTATGMLLIIGLVMVLSASSVTQLNNNKSPFNLFFRQGVFAVVGVGAACVTARLPVRFWKRIGLPLLFVSVCLQMLVFTPLGHTVNGNRNWVSIAGVQLQPSEIGKVALILFSAAVLAKKKKLLGDWRHVVIPVFMPAAFVVVGLVLLGRDLGTALVLLAVLAGILWVLGISWKFFAISAGVGAVGVLALVVGSSNRTERINAWLSCTNVLQCWQSRHGQFALADGGLSGLGLGGSREKWLWLPEPHNDFIFAIVGEELGIAGTLMILLLFGALALGCYRLIRHSDDMFVRLVTAGVMSWILVQAVINIGSVIGLLPIIGVPLPLVSYGGSALVATLGALGILISFARNEPAARRALQARPRVLIRTLAAVPRRHGGPRR